MKRLLRLLSAALVVSLLLVGPVVADTTTPSAGGTWVAHPGQAPLFQTAVQPPINTDGTSNFKANGKAVIPVKFSLAQGLGPFVFESIGSDSNTDNDFAFLSFTPNHPLTFNELTLLKADYAFTLGNCHGGSLRWSVRVSASASVFIYYGDYPNFTDCTSPAQSGTNLIGLSDLRYDTSQLAGGTFYDSYTHAQALVGTTPILRVSLVLDSGWGGDQRLTLTSATVNQDTFTPAPATALAPTCALPPATIKVTKTSGTPSGEVNEPISIQPTDDNGLFRVVDCKYLYNLATSALSGSGTYAVSAVINGTTVPSPAVFDLR